MNVSSIPASEAKSNHKCSHEELYLGTALLKRQDIARVLNVSESRARQLLAEHGVNPIDMGRGRGNGLRWRTSAVIEVADILHAEAQSQKKQALRQSRAFHPLRGKSAANLWAEFNGQSPR
ncbi:MAG: hypothetical protein IJD16_00580 [Desulfovibrio sp.]|nr:hypothetical protein [Desulfovibrio sp.]